MPIGGGLSHVGCSNSGSVVQVVQDERLEELRRLARRQVWTEKSVKNFKQRVAELEKWLSEKKLQQGESKSNESNELRYLRSRFDDIKVQLKNIEDQISEMVETKDVTNKGIELTVFCDHTNDHVTRAGTRTYRERQTANLAKNVAAKVAPDALENACLFLKSHEVLSVVRLVCKNWNNTGNTIFKKRYDRFRFIYSPLSGAMFDMSLIPTWRFDLRNDAHLETGFWYKNAKNLNGLIKYSKTWRELDDKRRQHHEVDKSDEDQVVVASSSKLALA